MRLSFLRAILCLPILLVLALPAVSLGAIFPNRDDGNTEIIILEESDLEIELRVKLILSATQSVQILNFMHVNDEVGLRLIAALRDRMQHGVTVQQAYEGSISVAK